MHDNDPEVYRIYYDYVPWYLFDILQVLDREKARNLSKTHKKSSPHEHAPGWNETLASASEASVKVRMSRRRQCLCSTCCLITYLTGWPLLCKRERTPIYDSRLYACSKRGDRWRRHGIDHCILYQGRGIWPLEGIRKEWAWSDYDSGEGGSEGYQRW